jgi:hypothetical protein
MNLSKLQSEAIKEFTRITHNQEFMKGVPVDLQMCWYLHIKQFLSDQIQKAVEETRKETIEIIENLKVKHSINPNSPSRERKIIYNNAIEEAKLSIQSKEK